MYSCQHPVQKQSQEQEREDRHGAEEERRKVRERKEGREGERWEGTLIITATLQMKMPLNN